MKSPHPGIPLHNCQDAKIPNFVSRIDINFALTIHSSVIVFANLLKENVIWKVTIAT